MPFLARLSGPLDAAAMEQALNALVARHESLRTTFFEASDDVYQQVADERPVELEVVAASGEDAAREVAAERLARPWDLAAGPLMRCTLARLGDSEHLLILALHHSIADGWSMGVLKRDLAELYRAAVDGRAPALAELEIQYGDYASWQRETLQGDRLAREIAHWRGVLDG